jgi:hypothetical protein
MRPRWDRERELKIIRRAYAKQVTAAAGVGDPQVEAAFAAVAREDFLGPGPWHGDTLGGPRTNGTAGPWLRAGARCPAIRSVHAAGVARIALLIGRVRRRTRPALHGGAPGERQDHEERGHLPPQKH